MAKPQKQPAPNQWIYLVVSAAVLVFIASGNGILWQRIIGWTLAAAELVYAAWLFRREWRWFHPKNPE